ncbi:MAG: flagellar export chaperone FliS [Burkholderiaceae bacterium]|nr:flagellar export chaperone FliS [Burkholderiaceae bacterium]
MFAPHRNNAGSYRNLDLETSVAQADPHKLIEMLFDGAAGAIAQARNALREGRIPAKGEATGRAVRILDEGLKASLDPRGGELAANLKSLYEYMTHRLLEANLANDDAKYAEVGGMLDQLRDAWKRIASQVRGSAAGAAAAPVATARGAAPVPA